MALNPIVYTEKVVRSFLRYQLTRFPFSDDRLYQQMRRQLRLEETRDTPLLKGPYVSLSRAFRSFSTVWRGCSWAERKRSDFVTSQPGSRRP